MSKNRYYGFTLIELLAVIVILAIIAIIAMPIILNIIEDSKKNSFIQTANGIIKAGEYYYANEILDGVKLNENKKFIFPDEIEGLEFDGEVPNQGEIIITKKGIALAISNGKYCITKGVNDKNVKLVETFEKCNLPDAVNEIMSSNDYCIISGKCENGTTVNVKVNDDEEYNFFVINDTGNEVALIMDRNLVTNSCWITADKYKNSNTDSTNCSKVVCNDEGPLTSLNILKEETNDWVNITETEINFFEDDTGKQYDIKEPIMVRARLLTYEEAFLLGCREAANSCPSYLYTNLRNTGDSNTAGYWLSTSHSIYDYAAWSVYLRGNLDNHVNSRVTDSSSAGVRPVITLKK